MPGLDAFKKVAKGTTATKKKVDRPEIDNPEFQSAVDSWLLAKQDEESAKSRKAMAEEVFLKAAVAKIEEASIVAGEPQSSVIINDKVMVTVQNRYGNTPVEHLPRLTEIFGEKLVGDYFQEKMEIKLTEAALNDPTIMEKLAKAVGAENIEKFFDVKQFVTPRPNFHNDRMTKVEVSTLAHQALDEGLITTPKGSVKAT